MTNSRLTDPEVLEFRFPVRLDSYEHPPRLGRRGPLARRRRRRAPRALPGADDGVDPQQRPPRAGLRHGRGQPGALGANRVERADGRVEVLDHWPGRDIGETPGGGGWGGT
jgi:5-oxoprolinase (ATP-hydrolysing)